MNAITITLAGISRLARIVADPTCDIIDARAAGNNVLIDLGYWAGRKVPKSIMSALDSLSTEARTMVDWEDGRGDDE
jgi:hypothetical protein